MATPRFAIRQIKISNPPTKNHPITSCTSSNPGNPDMANATLRYQTNKNPQGKRILFLECLLDKGFDDC